MNAFVNVCVGSLCVCACLCVGVCVVRACVWRGDLRETTVHCRDRVGTQGLFLPRPRDTFENSELKQTSGCLVSPRIHVEGLQWSKRLDKIKGKRTGLNWALATQSQSGFSVFPCWDFSF